MFVEFKELVNEVAVCGAVVYLFEEGRVSSAERLEHGDSVASEGLRLFYLYDTFHVDPVEGGLGGVPVRSVGHGCSFPGC